MHSMGYTGAITRGRHDMQCARIVGGEPGAVRADIWDYKAGYRDLSYAARKARKETVTVAMLDLAAADALRLAADADLASMRPGTLDFDGWEQRCYIAGVGVKAVTDGAAVVELEAVLLDGVWRKRDSYEFRPGTGSGTVGVGHGYDYGYAYGYPYSEETSREIEVDSIVASPFRIIVYGPAVRPSVTVGGNRYQVSTDVPDGGYLLIDSIEGIDSEDVGALSAIPRQIEGVDIGICIKEKTPGFYKVSLRSSENEDVSAIAQQFGGGGHARAAGCAFETTLEDAEKKIVWACAKALGNQI